MMGSGGDISARNPRTGRIDWTGTAADADEIASVAVRLRAAQPAWEARGAAARLEVLRSFGQALARHAGPISEALEADTGRRRIARLEIDSVVGSIDGWARVIANDALPEWVQGRGMPSVRHSAAWKAYPVVGVISPWNFPLLLGMIDAVPALLAGCAVVVKPSEVTPRFIAPVVAALTEVPELAAVFAVVVGAGSTGQAMVDAADCVCFTGSVATGRKVAVQAAGRLIPAYLELGGKDPLIVLEGADLDRATDAALRGSVLSTGQACQSIERIYVHRAAHSAFLQRLVEKSQAARLNWPDISAGEIGPIIFDRQADILAGQIADAVARGGLDALPAVAEDQTQIRQAQRPDMGPRSFMKPSQSFDRDHLAEHMGQDCSLIAASGTHLQHLGRFELCSRPIARQQFDHAGHGRWL